MRHYSGIVFAALKADSAQELLRKTASDAETMGENWHRTTGYQRPIASRPRIWQFISALQHGQ
jgi:hypothetical protein